MTVEVFVPKNDVTPAERRKAVQIVAAQEPELAEKIGDALSEEEDPVLALLKTALDRAATLGDAQVEAIRTLSSELKSEARTSRLWLIALVFGSMVLNSGLVGVSMVLRTGSWTMSTSTPSTEPLHTTATDIEGGVKD
ncbi:MAG: hypothetical protein ABL912_01975 [Novosphingobium sp.]